MKQAAGPFLGLFWVIERDGAPHELIAHRCPLVISIDSGNNQICPHNHMAVWNEFRTGKQTSEDQVPPIVRATMRQVEHEMLPRGRVLIDKETHFFMIFVEPRLVSRELMAEVARVFELPAGTAMIRKDERYQSTGIPEPEKRPAGRARG